MFPKCCRWSSVHCVLQYPNVLGPLAFGLNKNTRGKGGYRLEESRRSAGVVDPSSGLIWAASPEFHESFSTNISSVLFQAPLWRPSCRTQPTSLRRTIGLAPKASSALLTPALLIRKKQLHFLKVHVVRASSFAFFLFSTFCL